MKRDGPNPPKPFCLMRAINPELDPKTQHDLLTTRVVPPGERRQTKNDEMIELVSVICISHFDFILNTRLLNDNIEVKFTYTLYTRFWSPTYFYQKDFGAKDRDNFPLEGKSMKVILVVHQ